MSMSKSDIGTNVSPKVRGIRSFISPTTKDAFSMACRAISTAVSATARDGSLVQKASEGKRSKNDFDEYTGGPPRRQASSLEGWDEISYEVTEETFRVEYYAPLIEGGPDKTIAHQSRFLYPVKDLTVIVQKPYASTGFSVFPSSESTFNDGTFDNYQYTYTDLGKDEPVNFSISYNKSNPNPSLAILEGAAPNGAGTASDSSSLASVIVGVIFGAAILVSIGAVLVKRWKPKRRPAAKRVAVADHGGRPKTQSASSRFCTQCGQAVEKSHQFCPHCGSKVY